VRRQLEKVVEKLICLDRLKKCRDYSRTNLLLQYALGKYLLGITQFAALRGKGYSGNMGQLPDVIPDKDPEILRSTVYRVDDPQLEFVLYPRAVFAY